MNCLWGSISTLDWILKSFNILDIWLKRFKLTFPIFFPPFSFGSHWELKKPLFQNHASWGWATWYKFQGNQHNSPYMGNLYAYCYMDPSKDYQRQSNYKSGKSIRLPLPVLPLKTLQARPWLVTFITQKLRLQPTPLHTHCFPLVSIEILLIKYLIACTIGLTSGAHLHHCLLKWDTTI